MNGFVAIFKKVNGAAVLRQYAQSRVLFFALVQTALQGLSRTSLEIVRLSVNNRVLRRLRKKYRRFIADWKAQNGETLPRQRSNKVWVCWLQGMENAPDVVKRCYRSLQENLPDREIVLLTQENYRDYVSFPAFIEEKIQAGLITRTHLTDLLRLELLIRYGGTWIDSTVFCSGKNIPEYMLDSDLFLFQTLKPGRDGQATVISSWFITACTNHPILLLTRALLYEYWAHHKKMVDYFLLHDMFQLAIEAYPEEWERVIPADNAMPHVLLLRLFSPFDEGVWEALVQRNCFHKLSYKFAEEMKTKPGTYYAHLMNNGLPR